MLLQLHTLQLYKLLHYSFRSYGSKEACIACNSGDSVETVTNKLTGFLCEPSPIALSKAISALVNGHDLAVRMGR